MVIEASYITVHSVINTHPQLTTHPLASSVIGASPSEPHIYVKYWNSVYLSVCLSVCLEQTGPCTMMASLLITND